MKVLAKLRRGVLEVAAGDNCVYADPTFLQRAYLLWTFRNFRRLSVRVLNQRQRQLVERLGGSAHAVAPIRVNPALVIGRAEFATLPSSKVLETVIVRQIEKRHPASTGTGRLRTAGLLAKLPRDIAQQAAEAFSNSSVRRTRSNARYSLVLTLTLASLVVISGAVAQRLWISHGPSLSAGEKLSRPEAHENSGDVKAIQPLVTKSGSTAPNPLMASAATSAAAPVSLRAMPAPNKLKAVTPAAERVREDGELSNTEASAPASHIRVFLAPRSVIYPSLPNAGFAANGKKEILVKAVVNTDGTVSDVQVPGESPNIATAIAKSVRQWRYQPYLLNGQPVEVETRMIFTVLGPDTITVRFLPSHENSAND